MLYVIFYPFLINTSQVETKSQCGTVLDSKARVQDPQRTWEKNILRMRSVNVDKL